MKQKNDNTQEAIQNALIEITKGTDPCCNQPICTDLDSTVSENEVDKSDNYLM